jgi:hypothetical protein
MTTLSESAVKCSVCGTNSIVFTISSTNNFESPDLDSRPGEMERSTIDNWVQECSNCGLCSDDISMTASIDQQFLSSPDYVKQRNQDGIPEKAAQFMCFRLICLEQKNYSAAGWNAVHAAWVCDDEQINDFVSFREIAIEDFGKAFGSNQSYAQNKQSQALVTTDLHRVIGQFKEAKKIMESCISEFELEEPLLSIAKFQLHLINQQDSIIHKIEEAISFSNPS